MLSGREEALTQMLLQCMHIGIKKVVKKWQINLETGILSISGTKESSILAWLHNS